MRLLAIRSLIYTIAASTPPVGPLTETLKWGEPAYLTTASKTGTTIRLGWKANRPAVCALYVNCKTTLVDQYRSLFADKLRFEGNRAILLPVAGPFAEMPLAICIKMALTYHLQSR